MEDVFDAEVRYDCEHRLQGGGRSLHSYVDEVPAMKPRVLDDEAGDFVFQYALVSFRGLDPIQGASYRVLHARPVHDVEVKLREPQAPFRKAYVALASKKAQLSAWWSVRTVKRVRSR